MRDTQEVGAEIYRAWKAFVAERGEDAEITARDLFKKMKGKYSLDLMRAWLYSYGWLIYNDDEGKVQEA